MLPFKISILDTEWVKEQPHDDQKAVIDVENYKLQEKENSAARYRLAFPKGSTVFDVRTDQVFRLDKESELDDDTISRAIDTKIKQGQMDRQEAQMLIDSVLATQPATQPAPAEHP
jgi:hypothetical protein